MAPSRRPAVPSAECRTIAAAPRKPGAQRRVAAAAKDDTLGERQETFEHG
jgi:hypothetical protein